MEINKEMAKRITAYRKKLGMSQLELAKKQGLSQSSVSRHENETDNWGRVEDYLNAGATPQDFDQMIYGIQTRPEENWKLKEYFQEGGNTSLRLKEELRFQMEESDAVVLKFGRDLKAMQMESMLKDDSDYNVYKNLKFQSRKSWEKLAIDSQLSQRTLRRYVNGKQSPKMLDLLNMCQAFQTIPSVLISNSIYQDYLFEQMLQTAGEPFLNRLSAYFKLLMK